METLSFLQALTYKWLVEQHSRVQVELLEAAALYRARKMFHAFYIVHLNSHVLFSESGRGFPYSFVSEVLNLEMLRIKYLLA